MLREKLIIVCTCEIAGRVRGKGFPVGELASRLVSGVGWVPTNTMISALGPIGDTPFGATGDLILVPDPGTEVLVDFEDGSAAEHFFLGDIRHTDGRPWECCPREFLRRGLAALKDAAGLELYAAFEHELVYTGVEDLPGSPYSLEAWRRQGIFGEVLTAAIRKAGVQPDTFLPEYAKRQYEVTIAPQLGMKSADDAVKLREMARATAFRLGHRAIFSPILDPNGTGSGVHIHFSFQDADGQPATRDASRPYGLTPVAESFMAGVVAHLPAICAVTAPSPVSYFRLRPNRWAPTWAYVADRDREACLRICPVLDLPGARFRRAVQRRVQADRRRGKPVSRARRTGARRRRRHPRKAHALPAERCFRDERERAGGRRYPSSAAIAQRGAQQAGGNSRSEGVVRPGLSRRLPPP